MNGGRGLRTGPPPKLVGSTMWPDFGIKLGSPDIGVLLLPQRRLNLTPSEPCLTQKAAVPDIQKIKTSFWSPSI